MIEKAKKIIRECESQLRNIISQAATQGEYESLLQLTDWAKIISSLFGDNSSPLTTPQQVSQIKKTSVRKKKTYPKFKRLRDSLIKIGWSKKSKKEYQHKVSEKIIFEVLSHLSKMKNNRLFTTDDIFPIIDTTGQEIPGYQVYICIAWFKEISILLQEGRQGYKIANRENFELQAKEAWQSLLKQEELT